MLVEDHTLVRAAIRAILETIPGVEVVGEASNGHEALELFRFEVPDLILMDIAMPNLGGLETLPRIVKRFPSARVVILSAYATEDYVTRAFRSGASGYILKNAAPVELTLMIESITHGKVYVSSSVSRIIIDSYMKRGGRDLNPLEQLTSRQRGILKMIAVGKNTREIAFALAISVKTVEVHRLQLMARLDIHDVAGLVRFAIRNRLVDA